VALQLEWLFAQGREALDFLVYNEIVKQTKVSSGRGGQSPKSHYENDVELAKQSPVGKIEGVRIVD